MMTFPALPRQTKFSLDRVKELRSYQSQVNYDYRCPRNILNKLDYLSLNEVGKVFPDVLSNFAPVSVKDLLPNTFLYRPFRSLDLWLDGTPFVKARQTSKLELDFFSSLQQDKHKIYFSCDPYDLMTMSMRGIQSCMTWGSAPSMTLIGSMVDPYCGIIILTDDVKSSDGLGTKIIARSVVRYVHNLLSSDSLFLERVYISSHSQYIDHIGGAESAAPLIKDLFVSYLTKRTKLPVHTSVAFSKKIPKDPKVMALPQEYWSYRDSRIDYAS